MSRLLELEHPEGGVEVEGASVVGPVASSSVRLSYANPLPSLRILDGRTGDYENFVTSSQYVRQTESEGHDSLIVQLLSGATTASGAFPIVTGVPLHLDYQGPRHCYRSTSQLTSSHSRLSAQLPHDSGVLTPEPILSNETTSSSSQSTPTSTIATPRCQHHQCRKTFRRPCDLRSVSPSLF